jgi:dimeric dUTPase (all-alpha-NTP-PPase superfamily)
MDQLRQIWLEQAELNKRLGIDTGSCATVSPKMDERERNFWLIQYLTALFAETGETLNLTNYRWWKKEKQLDWAAVQEELIDALHFLVSAMQVSGLDADRALETYLRKNRVNHERQDKGY